MYNPFYPKPAPPGFAKASPLLPEGSASWLSRLVFHWLSPFLDVGFSRPLEQDDLWELPQSKQTAELTDRVERLFYARCPPEQRPIAFRAKSSRTNDIDSHATEKDLGDTKGDGINSKSEGAKKSQYDSSLFKALHRAFIVRWWIAGFMHLIGDTLRTTSPLVTKVLLTWLSESFIYHRAPGSIPQPRGIGYGIGVGIALFAMQGEIWCLTLTSSDAYRDFKKLLAF
ncbi:hypothetical protein HGRIS_014251 [Hohenbuehelia grisea]|uniref:ABC transmembrane type-1 domain-containing protein n=1 Tax=Hohenbuehelia grisea TaxID=104357 RepID=A0ABR3JU84_9AGAR